MTSPTTARPTSGETTESREPGAAVGVTRIVHLEQVIRDSIESLERNSTSAPVVECLKAALRSPAPDATVSEPVAWRVRVPDGSCTAWFDGKPPNYYGPYEVAYSSPQDVGREAVSAKRGFAFPSIVIDWQQINAQQFENSRSHLLAKLTRFMSPECKEVAYWTDNHFTRDDMYVLHELMKAATAPVSTRAAVDPDAQNDKRADDDMRLASNVREAVIEECARVSENGEGLKIVRDNIARAIRSLAPGASR